MKDSSINPKEIMDLLATIGESTETAAAAVGVLTELVREINAKVPLHDLLEQVAVFVRQELGPSVKSIQDYMWDCRHRAAGEIATVYKHYFEKTNNAEHALALTMATMQFWEHADQNLAKGIKQGSENQARVNNSGTATK